MLEEEYSYENILNNMRDDNMKLLDNNMLLYESLESITDALEDATVHDQERSENG